MGRLCPLVDTISETSEDDDSEEGHGMCFFLWLLFGNKDALRMTFHKLEELFSTFLTEFSREQELEFFFCKVVTLNFQCDDPLSFTPTTPSIGRGSDGH
jgi:hypothetical protein